MMANRGKILVDREVLGHIGNNLRRNHTLTRTINTMLTRWTLMQQALAMTNRCFLHLVLQTPLRAGKDVYASLCLTRTTLQHSVMTGVITTLGTNFQLHRQVIHIANVIGVARYYARGASTIFPETFANVISCRSWRLPQAGQNS